MYESLFVWKCLLIYEYVCIIILLYGSGIHRIKHFKGQHSLSQHGIAKNVLITHFLSLIWMESVINVVSDIKGSFGHQ